jgi:hypothetical protein
VATEPKAELAVEMRTRSRRVKFIPFQNRSH